MKKCPKCGTMNQDEYKYCEQCGTALEGNGTPGQPAGEQPQGQTVASNKPGVFTRNIVLAIIFSIITCGIYGIYWMVKMNDEVNQLAGENTATTGGMVLLFTIITCGVYAIYWSYRMGERCDKIKGTTGNTAIVYLLLTVFGLSIITSCLIQDTINKAVQ